MLAQKWNSRYNDNNSTKEVLDQDHNIQLNLQHQIRVFAKETRYINHP